MPITSQELKKQKKEAKTLKINVNKLYLRDSLIDYMRGAGEGRGVVVRDSSAKLFLGLDFPPL